ncbi:MAG TPA: SRPBCC domain-containing protein [Solirubrobacteraceae bacterium]|jgi:uncharacterized protein YndB with AHSA1/START domain|nr:SRPBCC domain-containing protein [Solirubrobacteraceae bacterium]
MTDGTQAAIGLRLERTFDAPRDEVFDAWTNPEVMRRWWAAGRDWSTPLAEVDLREGGRYRLSMHNPENDETHTVAGEYREVKRPAKLVYTWLWETDPEPNESVVTVEFHDRGGATDVVLVHEGLASEQSREAHEHGWVGVLENLKLRVFPGA